MLFSVSMVRNEADIIALNVLHHLAMGVDRMLFADNDSTDGTQRMLTLLRKHTDKVGWWSVPGPYDQQATITWLARTAYNLGAEWVLPVDADEFWTARGNMKSILSTAKGDWLAVEVVNFIQRRRQPASSHDAILHMTRRATRLYPTTIQMGTLIDHRKIAYCERRYPSKTLVRANEHVSMSAGGHGAQNLRATGRNTALIKCLHAPLRSMAVLKQKATVAPRLTMPTMWQFVRWDKCLHDGTLDQEWAANSYARDGSINVYGRHHPTVADYRLRDAVKPWIRHARRLTERGL